MTDTVLPQFVNAKLVKKTRTMVYIRLYIHIYIYIYIIYIYINTDQYILWFISQLITERGGTTWQLVDGTVVWLPTLPRKWMSWSAGQRKKYEAETCVFCCFLFPNYSTFRKWISVSCNFRRTKMGHLNDGLA